MTDKEKAAALLVFAAVALAAAEVIVVPPRDDKQAHYRVGTPAPGMLRASCPNVVLAPEALKEAGLDATEKVNGKGTACVYGLDERGIPVKLVQPGVYFIGGCTTTKELCDPQVDALIDVWLQGNANATWDCACSSGANCLWSVFLLHDDGTVDSKVTSVDAPLGVAMSKGTWSGTGCVPRPCVDISGSEERPDSCPAAQ